MATAWFHGLLVGCDPAVLESNRPLSDFRRMDRLSFLVEDLPEDRPYPGTKQSPDQWEATGHDPWPNVCQRRAEEAMTVSIRGCAPAIKALSDSINGGPGFCDNARWRNGPPALQLWKLGMQLCSRNDRDRLPGRVWLRHSSLDDPHSQPTHAAAAILGVYGND